MRHLAIISTLFLIGSTTLYGQAPAPTGGDACGYRWYTTQATVVDSTPTYNWVDISSTGQLFLGLGDDNYAGPINPPSLRVSTGTIAKFMSVPMGTSPSGGVQCFSGAFALLQSLSSMQAAPNEWIGVYLSDITFIDENGNLLSLVLSSYMVQTRMAVSSSPGTSVPYWNGNAPARGRAATPSRSS